MFLLDDPANTDQSQKVLFCNQELSFVTCQSLRLVTRRQSRSRGSDTNNYWLKLIINSHTLCWAQSTVQQIGDISIEGWDGDWCKLLVGVGRGAQLSWDSLLGSRHLHSWLIAYLTQIYYNSSILANMNQKLTNNSIE